MQLQNKITDRDRNAATHTDEDTDTDTNIHADTCMICWGYWLPILSILSLVGRHKNRVQT